MNTLITDRKITAADVLREREIRAKVMYSPCVEQDIKWRWCDCYVCRSVWDPTGEIDAERANALREVPKSEPESEQKQEDDECHPECGCPDCSPDNWSSDAEHEAEEEAKEEPNLEIPMSLPEPEGTNEKVELSGAEVNTIMRQLQEYSESLQKDITKIVDHMQERVNGNYLPIAPPELDNLFCSRTEVENMIRKLSKKPRT